MNVSLIDKDLFASLLRYGEVILPDYSFSVISEDLPIEDALRAILRSGNPIEYPSQYIIVLYDCSDNSNILPISAVKELIATDIDGRRLFSSQFREDLIIQSERYKAVFQEYLDNDFQKAKIRKGIASFRTLCGLDVANNYDKDVDIIYRGIANRIRYRHHFQLPAEERDEPYALMISYDRHAPYPRGWAGYFYDVIETYCYHCDPNLGYSETVIEGTGIYKLISALPQDAVSKQIEEAIKDEKFTHLCNEFFDKPGGYLVPYIFFILRDRFRDAESYSKHAYLIRQIKEQFPEAFDTASIFVGGFFGYEKFYDDYYTALNLPILRSRHPFRSPELAKPVPDKTEEVLDKVDVKPAEIPGASAPKVDAKVAVEDHAPTKPEAGKESEPKDSTDEGVPTPPTPDGEEKPKDIQDVNPNQSIPDETMGGVFIDGMELFKVIYDAIDGCLKDGVEKNSILIGLRRHKNDNEALKKIYGLFLSPFEKKELIKEYLSLSRYPGKSIKSIRTSFQKSENK